MVMRRLKGHSCRLDTTTSRGYENVYDEEKRYIDKHRIKFGTRNRN